MPCGFWALELGNGDYFLQGLSNAFKSLDLPSLIEAR
jgi:hypothetical protein